MWIQHDNMQREFGNKTETDEYKFVSKWTWTKAMWLMTNNDAAYEKHETNKRNNC